MLHLLGQALFGLVVGVIAKVAFPGPDPGGIIVTALNRKNMLTVPDNERSAWARQLFVFSRRRLSVRHAITASTATEMSPRTKIVWPLGMACPSNFTHNVMPENRTSEASFRAMPRTGR